VTVPAERQRRLAANESLVRDVNERIEEGAERFELRAAEFLCECARETCNERIRMPLREYEAVRAHGERFAIVPGHEIPDVERVVEAQVDWAVVEKFDAGADVARAADPRS
jgi:hypothetical protein